MRTTLTSRVYAAMQAHNAPLTAQEIAQATGIPLQPVYNAVSGLLRVGAIGARVRSPGRVSPIREFYLTPENDRRRWVVSETH